MERQMADMCNLGGSATDDDVALNEDAMDAFPEAMPEEEVKSPQRSRFASGDGTPEEACSPTSPLGRRKGAQTWSPDTRPQSATRPPSGKSGIGSDVQTDGCPSTADPGDKADPLSDVDSESPRASVATPSSQTRWRKLRALSGTIGVIKTYTNKNKLSHAEREENAKEQREKELKIRRSRQEALHNAAASNPLPAVLCERELMTTWVGPLTKRLVPGEKDRCILRKTSAEAYRLKMDTAPFPMMPLRTSSSMGSLDIGRQTSKSSRARRLGKAQRDEDDGTGTRSTDMGTANNRLQPLGPLSSSSGKPRDAMQVADSAEKLWLEPPRNVSSKVILQRLDDQKTSFRKTTFSAYTKEYDVMTGVLRVRFDEARLRREENAYLQKMDTLVGGQPARNTMHTVV